MRRNEALICTAIGLLLTAAVAVLFRFTDLDLTLQRLVDRSTVYGTQQPWLLLRDYGTWPGVAVALTALAMVAVSFVRDSARRWRYPALFVFSFFVIGSGLVTNLLGKMLFGRPRPQEIAGFGGSLPFHRAFEFGHPGGGFSFLCGDCSTAYLFLAFFFLWRGARRWMALAGALLFGLLIGAGRVLQASHFASDVLLDATIMFTVGAALSPLAFVEPKPVVLPQWKVVLVATVVAAVTIIAFLFSSPVHNEWSFLWLRRGQREPAVTHQERFAWRDPASILFAAQKGDVRIEIQPQREPLRIGALVQGFGFPGAGNVNAIEEFQNRRILSFDDRLTGMYWEVHGEFRISIADDVGARVIVRADDGDVVVDASGSRRPVRLFVAARRLTFLEHRP